MRLLERFQALGADVEGQVGHPSDESPITVIWEVLEREPSFDLMCLDLPPGISRWLGLDLPHRVARLTASPLEHIVAEAEPAPSPSGCATSPSREPPGSSVMVGQLTSQRPAAPASHRTMTSALCHHVVNTRYEKRHPTIVTANRGLPDWGQVFGDPVVAVTIPDRLMHKAVVFNIKGPSWRLHEHQALTIGHRRPQPKQTPLTCPPEEPVIPDVSFGDR